MSDTNQSTADRKTVIETGREYLDTAVQAAKDHPAAAAGIAAGVVAAAAGAAYGASVLKARRDGAVDDEQLIIDPQRVPETIPGQG